MQREEEEEAKVVLVQEEAKVVRVRVLRVAPKTTITTMSSLAATTHVSTRKGELAILVLGVAAVFSARLAAMSIACRVSRCYTTARK